MSFEVVGFFVVLAVGIIVMAAGLFGAFSVYRLNGRIGGELFFSCILFVFGGCMTYWAIINSPFKVVMQ